MCGWNLGVKQMENRNKKGVTWDNLIPWLIAITVLVLMTIFAFLLKDKLVSFAEYIKNLFR